MMMLVLLMMGYELMIDILPLSYAYSVLWIGTISAIEMTSLPLNY